MEFRPVHLCIIQPLLYVHLRGLLPWHFCAEQR